MHAASVLFALERAFFVSSHSLIFRLHDEKQKCANKRTAANFSPKATETASQSARFFQPEDNNPSRLSLSLGANILFYEETAGCGARLSCNYHNKTTAGNRGIEMRKVIKQRPSPDLN
jgi:hypothetical protein